MGNHYIRSTFSKVLLPALLILLNCTMVLADVVEQGPVSSTIRHFQYFDSAGGSVLTDQKEGVSKADFRFETTGYRFGGIGSINGNFVVSMHPYKGVTAARVIKIKHADFDTVSRSTCNTARYNLSNEQIVTVSDGDIVCLSLDEDRDGVFGDAYLKIKIISHADSELGPYADSMTFLYSRLE